MFFSLLFCTIYLRSTRSARCLSLNRFPNYFTDTDYSIAILRISDLNVVGLLIDDEMTIICHVDVLGFAHPAEY